MRTQPNALPINPQLLQAKHWLVWRLIPNPDPKKKGRKVPHWANGKQRAGKLDTPRDYKNLTDHAEAAKVVALGTYEGLGFAVSQGFQFLDLDSVRDAKTGNLEPWALTLQNAAIDLGAFIEVSHSGKGLHIFGYGPPLPDTGKLTPQVEAYDSGRFMAMGRHVVNTGTDPMPDLTPLYKLLPRREVVARKTPQLSLVKPSSIAWAVDRPLAIKALEKIDPAMPYDGGWVKVGMALHAASGGSQDGLDLWIAWSKCAPERFTEGECERCYAGFKAGGGIGLGTLLHMAGEVDSSRVIKPKPRVTGPVEDAVIRRTRFTDDELMDTEHGPTPWFVEGLLAPGLTLLAAPPKMGKSYFVMQMGMSIAAGKPFLGKPVRQATVCYFNLEEWEELIFKRRVDIGRALQVGKLPRLHYVVELDPEVSIEDEVEAQVTAGVEVIIIDLLARVRDEMNEDAKKNAYSRDYAALRKFSDLILQRFPKLSIIIVHHTNKGQHDNWQGQISGSNGLAGASHCNMLLANLDLRGLEDEARQEALRFRRFHAAGKLVQGQELMLEMMPDMGGWKVSDKTESDVKGSAKQQHVMQLLREANGAWMSAKELHAEVEGTLDALKKLLQRMRKKGLIESAGQGGDGYRILPSA